MYMNIHLPSLHKQAKPCPPADGGGKDINIYLYI